MKKVLFIMVMLITSLSFIGCQNADSQLKQALEETNKEYPAEIEAGMVMEKVFDDGNNIVYKCIVDENLYDVAVIEARASEIKPEIKGYLTSQPATKALIDVLKKTNKGVVYRYIGEQSGKQADIVISVDEL